MLLGESRAWDEHHRAIEKNEYIPTDSESIRGARSENRSRGKVGVSGLPKPIIQWTLNPTRKSTGSTLLNGDQGEQALIAWRRFGKATTRQV